VSPPSVGPRPIIGLMTTPTILLVDDDAHLREIVGMALTASWTATSPTS
jgi:hypothetical protein